MPKKHKVKKGDCVASIAMDNGFFLDTIWDDSANAKLKEDRESPYVLLEGDVVVVPDKRLKEESCADSQRHTFRRKGVPEILKLQFLSNGEPRAKLPYSLNIDGRWFEGETDDEGRIEQAIPPDATKGKLTLDNHEKYDLKLGHIAPVSEKTGVCARLANLGYLSEADSDDELLKDAVRLFQDDNDLEATGQINDKTRDLLRDKHGC